MCRPVAFPSTLSFRSPSHWTLSPTGYRVEDVPGIGKTTLCKAIARSISCSFRRIQLTPDVLPSDVTGLYFFNRRTGDFEFRPGPCRVLFW